jgi:hypothetical protein
MNRTELSREAYNDLWEDFTAQGAVLHSGEHEGASLVLGRTHLCHSDGLFWLLVEQPPSPDVCGVCGGPSERYATFVSDGAGLCRLCEGAPFNGTAWGMA